MCGLGIGTISSGRAEAGGGGRVLSFGLSFTLECATAALNCGKPETSWPSKKKPFDSERNIPFKIRSLECRKQNIATYLFI